MSHHSLQSANSTTAPRILRCRIVGEDSADIVFFHEGAMLARREDRRCRVPTDAIAHRLRKVCGNRGLVLGFLNTVT
jgi:hypothetical protein